MKPILHIHNTLTAQKEPFVPLTPGEVRMYVCGVTPYDSCHLGHARCYVVFDVIRRVLYSQGYFVRHVQNFTDVDDKIIARAVERGISPRQLADQNIQDFYQKMDALNIQRASMYPLVTQHIPEIITFIERLIEKQYAYVLNGDVYFAVRKDADYGKLSKRSLDDLKVGARVSVDEGKKDPLDFALWKAAKPGEPDEVTWESPWGKGRPGWHIECSVMSLKHLGGTFDIHGGGLDLIFPHHENEIAQSESATGEPFAKVWIHNGFVTVNKEKMSKSLGNFFSLSDIFKQFQPMVVRYMLLTMHYRSPLNFSQDLLLQSKQTMERLQEVVARAEAALKRASASVNASPDTVRSTTQSLEAFEAALADDFNTPEALGSLHQLARMLDQESARPEVSSSALKHVLKTFQQCAGLLGLVLEKPQAAEIPSDVLAMAQARHQARADKNWKESDRLRAEILEKGYVVEDTPQGPRVLPK